MEDRRIIIVCVKMGKIKKIPGRKDTRQEMEETRSSRGEDSRSHRTSKIHLALLEW